MHSDVHSQVCFHGLLFSSLSDHEGALLVLWGHWMALIRVCVVPNCSQRLSRPVLWIVTVSVTYWTHTAVVSVLTVPLTRLRLPTLPLQPPAHHLKRAISDITVAVKKLLKIQ